MDIETTLAKASTKREDLRNPETNYHKLTLVQLGELTPHLSWADYFKQVGAPRVSAADIAQTGFLQGGGRRARFRPARPIGKRISAGT